MCVCVCVHVCVCVCACVRVCVCVYVCSSHLLSVSNHRRCVVYTCHSPMSYEAARERQVANTSSFMLLKKIRENYMCRTVVLRELEEQRISK